MEKVVYSPDPEKDAQSRSRIAKPLREGDLEEALCQAYFEGMNRAAYEKSKELYIIMRNLNIPREYAIRMLQEEVGDDEETCSAWLIEEANWYR